MAKYYYNGVLLPEIPADVLMSYPYCWIRKNGTTGYYDLVVATALWYFDGSSTLYKSVSGNFPYYRIPIATHIEYDEWPYHTNSDLNFGLDSARTVLWSNHDIPNGFAASTTIYFYGSEPVPEIPPFAKKYLIRSNSTLYTVIDGALSALTEAEITASLFQTYGVDILPDGELLVDLTDPEVLYWHDSADDLPGLTATVTGAPSTPKVVTSGPQDLRHETIKGISHAAVTASTDVLFAISFDGGATWIAHDGTAWYAVTEETPGMTAEQFNAITTEHWAEVVVLDAYLVRFWLPNTTASVTSVVLHYINP